MDACGLESEDAFYREHPDSVRRGLMMAGATKAEMDFLLHNRVELNAFASDQLIEWIEGKLEQHGVRKVIPDQEMLAEAYRRQQQSIYLKNQLGELLRSRQHIASLDIQASLQGQVARLLEEKPELSWNDAVAEIVGMRTDRHCDEA